jgi:hypothetical protein
MTKNNSTTAQSQTRSEADLDSRYGAIGIPAVAAALQFKGEVKNPVAAPAAPQPRDERLADIAA